MHFDAEAVSTSLRRVLPAPVRTTRLQPKRRSASRIASTTASSQLKVLPGNIRYLESVGFFWGGDKTKEAYDNAMRFLKGGDAIIIDMRQNGGGSPDAVRYMISHFLEPNTPIVTFYMRGDRRTNAARALASLPAGPTDRQATLRADRRPQRQRSRGIHRPCRRLQDRRAGRRERPPARAIATNSSPSPAAM